MAFFRRWFLVLLALLLLAGEGAQAGSKKEQHDYQVAAKAFQDGMWNLAELEFGQFVITYPDSTNVPDAWLFQAQAAFHQGKYPAVESSLTSHLTAAGYLKDGYTYWIGEAQYQSGAYQLAAATFESLLLQAPKTSAYALPAAVEGAAAMARLNQWADVIAFLTAHQDLFDAAVRTDPDNELVLRGKLLLAQAHFAQGRFAEAAQTLASVQAGKLPPELEWQRLNLLCHVKLDAGDLAAALPLSEDLLKQARLLPGDPVSLANSVALHASVLENLGRLPEAVAAYRENVATNAPEDRQREAILKMAELSIARQQFTNAEATLGAYVAQFTNSAAMDAALLALGELYLNDYVSRAPDPSLLAAARAKFDQLLAAHGDSPFAGKAYLDRGWCGWLATNYDDSLADFQKAATLLKPSADLLVAQFKAGDALLARGKYAEALAQYQAVLRGMNDFPEVKIALGGLARYQSLRAQLEIKDLAGAATNMAQIVADYPTAGLRESSSLLLGQGYADLRQPANALALFQKFVADEPNSPLRPAVDLAIARAYVEEQDWPAALHQYDQWVSVYPTNKLISQAMYSRAWANYQAGNESNALILFTNFVAQFPTNELAPVAQMWVADHYFRLGDWVNAELKYQSVFENTNWQGSDLYYPAKMSAGRAAVSYTAYDEAIRDYFQKLEVDTNCPLDLRVQAAFAHGSAEMKMDSPDTNNPLANYQTAITVFSQISTAFPTNEWGARAWGEIGDCNLQLSRYDDATNAYAQAIVISTNQTLRSQAKVALGTVLEKKAALLPVGSDQTNLLTQALACYWEVFNQDDPDRDLIWTKEAGLKAAVLESALGHWRQASLIYSNLIALMPELKDSLARKMSEAAQHVSPTPP